MLRFFHAHLSTLPQPAQAKTTHSWRAELGTAKRRRSRVRHNLSADDDLEWCVVVARVLL